MFLVSNWKLLDHQCCLEKEGTKNSKEHLHIQPGPVGLAPVHLHPLHLAGRAQQAVPFLPVAAGLQVNYKLLVKHARKSVLGTFH